VNLIRCDLLDRREEFLDLKWEIPFSIWVPGDKTSKDYESYKQRYYNLLYFFARGLRPRSIVEIGVRGGYSSYALLSGAKEYVERYLGIDNNSSLHGGMVGYIEHAKKLLLSSFPSVKIEFMICDSSTIKELPSSFDLGYIDGNHDFDFCYSDLALFSKFCTHVLIDDFDYIPDVKRAVTQFLSTNPSLFRVGVYVPSFRGHIFLSKNDSCFFSF